MAEASSAHPRPKAVAARILAALAGAYAVIAGFGGLFDLSTAGFPDGYVTEYDRAVRTPFMILNAIGIIVGLYFFYLAIFINRRHVVTTIIVSFVLYCTVVPGALFGIEYYLKNYTSIDYGQGG